MKNEMTIKILEDISKQHDTTAEQRTFDKAIAALKYCKEHSLTYYVEGKYFRKFDEEQIQVRMGISLKDFINLVNFNTEITLYNKNSQELGICKVSDFDNNIEFIKYHQYKIYGLIPTDKSKLEVYIEE